MKLGAATIQKAYVGGSPISAAYLGSSLLWSAGGFLPSDVADLYQWYKADGLGYVDGDRIGLLPDESGGGRDATATADDRPTFKIAGGKPVIRFAGGQHFKLGNLSALTAGELFVVIKINEDPPPVDAKTGFCRYHDAGASSHFPYTDGVIYDGFATTARKTVGNPTPSLSAAFRIYNVYSAFNDWAAELDGTLLYSTGSNAVAFGAFVEFGRSEGSYWMESDVTEIIFYSRKLTSTERSDVRTYLQSRL